MSHVYHPRRWNSPLHPPAGRSLEQLEHVDAWVVLTQRQREDVELLHGSRSNLFVLPNPGEPEPPPDPMPERDPHLLVVIARLERVKRVDDAVRAFAEVVRRVPEARLEVYGEGRLRLPLQKLVHELGLSGSVRLLGHRPDARDRLWRASGLLLTSRSEGFPLAPLEAFARGCPVVSYDIKYGPREQVEDGVSGFLVPPGDTAALAERAARLLSSPDLVASMGAAGLARVTSDRDHYVERWATILRTALEARARRTRLEEVRLTVDTLEVRKRTRLRFRGSLRVDAAPTQASLADADLRLDAVDDATGAVVPLELGASLRKHTWTLRARADLDAVRKQVGADRVDLRLRLRLTWENSSWETDLGRPPGDAPRWAADTLDDGSLRLRGR